MSDAIASNTPEQPKLSPPEVYERYMNKLLRLAHRKLAPRLRSKLDAEDVVQSVFRTYYRRRTEGLIATDGGSLWGLLATITGRKCNKKVAHYSAQKRSIDRESNTNPTDVHAHEPGRP